LIRGTVIWGTYLALATELLSAVSAVNQSALALAWLTPSLALLVLTLRHVGSWNRIVWPQPTFQEGLVNRLLTLGVIAFFLATAAVALIAPPNTYDALTYHMSRVAHWAQNGSINPYSTGILRQLFMSPGAEFTVLHTYVLSQGDRMANLVQWFAMLVSIVAVTSLAKELGAGNTGQKLAAIFAVSLPVGIAQASSAMTDYVVAMWVVIVAFEVLMLFKRKDQWSHVAFMSMAAGLAILTKPTSFAYLLPLAIIAAAILLRMQQRKLFIAMITAAVSIVLVINAGYLARNLAVFGSALGEVGLAARYRMETISWQAIVSNVLRNASLHAGTPITSLNDLLHTALAKLHVKLGLGLDDARTSVHPLFVIWEYLSDELRASNTLQAVLIVISFTLLIVKRKAFNSRVWIYAMASASSFLIFSIAFKFDILGSRFHLPFFLLLAPVVGLIITRKASPLVTALLSGVLVIGGLPILLGLGSRPLLNTAKEESILTASRQQLYFAQAPGLDEPYREMVDLIQAEQCGQVGIMLSGDAPEYPLWVLLGATRESIRMDWIIARSDPSGSYRSEDFTPCAMVCGSCPKDWIEFRGMPLVYNQYGHRLFLELDG
jgi:hypothetical protein